MPQILPFKETIFQNNVPKEKTEKLADIKSDENINEILAHLIKDNHDSMGHEIPHSFNNCIFQQDLQEPIKKERKRNMVNSFDCDEGYDIGRLIIYKDKRAKMVFGDINFEIVNGIQSNFCQELVGIDSLEKSAKPKAYFLSNINKKFICKPEIQNLLE